MECGNSGKKWKRKIEHYFLNNAVRKVKTWTDDKNYMGGKKGRINKQLGRGAENFLKYIYVSLPLLLGTEE